MSRRPNNPDGRLLLRLAAMVEDLRERVADLEAEQRRHGTAIDWNRVAIETIGEALAETDDDDEEGAMIQ
jgi:hypothetical protein